DLARESYLYLVQSAYRMSQPGTKGKADKPDKKKAINLLKKCSDELRKWEWHYVDRLLHGEKPTVNNPGWAQGHRAQVESVAYSRSGEFLASLDRDGEVKLWDARTGLPQNPFLRAKVDRSPAGGRQVTFSLG